MEGVKIYYFVRKTGEGSAGWSIVITEIVIPVAVGIKAGELV